MVADVRAFAGHIACDPHAASEIVVQVFDVERRLIAGFDVDSEIRGPFDEADRTGLEVILKRVFAETA